MRHLVLALVSAILFSHPCNVMAVDTTATVSQSQVSSTFADQRLTVALPAFSFSGLDDTVRVLFSSPIQIEFFGPGAGFATAVFQAQTDGIDSNFTVSGGSSALLDANLQPLPAFMGDGSHINNFFGNFQIFSNLPTLPDSNGESRVIAGFSFQGGQNFNTANITSGTFQLVVGNSNNAVNTPGRITVIPEPSSLALFSVIGLLAVRRRPRQGNQSFPGELK